MPDATATGSRRAAHLRTALGVGAVIAIAAGISRPVGAADAGGPVLVQLLLFTAAGALTRRFGIALPGGGFASFILSVVLAAVLVHGWGLAVVAAALAIFVGDLTLRRLHVAQVAAVAAHLAFGPALSGLLYEAAGGVTGTGVLTAANLAGLVIVCLALPLIVNGTFYLELALRGMFAWRDARLTLRWEGVVYAALLSGVATPKRLAGRRASRTGYRTSVFTG